jgi:hypothetical protein
MTGRAEVERLKQKLDATFGRALGVQGDAELLSDFARYLCVLVAGFLEQSMQELILEYSRNSASTAVQRYVESQIRRFTNVNAERLVQLLGSFNQDWQVNLKDYLVDERKDAVNSVLDLRHAISHGRYAGGITMARIRGHYDQIKKVVDRVADVCDPQ